MSDRTESTIVIGAPPSAVLHVIADFEAYPEWTGAVKRAEVLESDAADRPVRALFELDAGAIRDTYTLDYTWAVDGAGVGSLSWTLHEPSTVLKALDGTYELHPAADGTAVRYALAVDVPGVVERVRVADRAGVELEEGTDGAVAAVDLLDLGALHRAGPLGVGLEVGDHREHGRRRRADHDGRLGAVGHGRDAFLVGGMRSRLGPKATAAPVLRPTRRG